MLTKIGSSLLLAAFAAYLFHLTLADLDCRQAQNEGKAFPNDRNTSSYFVCADRQAEVRSCPPSTAYNDSAQKCTATNAPDDGEGDGSGDDGEDDDEDGDDDGGDDGCDDSVEIDIIVHPADCD